jgi:RNA polymerase sigma-70 factor (ECF subfamily)
VSAGFAIDVSAPDLAAARRGEVKALERIYRAFERPVYTLALRLLGDPDQAREALQDALMAAFGRLGQYRGDAPFWAWLRPIVVNTALMDRRRRRRVQDREVGLPEDDDLAGTGADPALFAAEAGALERALSALPDTTRAVVWLYCVEGYSHPEIASQMQHTVSFSKSQLARGLARLRQLLAVEQESSHARCP